jgi:cysteinyl-tRNA synthetase
MLKLYNSLTREIEEFKPISRGKVGFYTCGPTVYHFATIGNFRTYTTADLLLRFLRDSGLAVKYVMNITDVGHLTGDNLGDADTGEDRMESSAKREGKSVWEVAQFYTDIFLEDYDKLHITRPNHLVKATDHIPEQIDLIETLEERGYTYETSDGIYFDTDKFPKYGELSNLDEIKEGARVEVNPEKRNPRDFALWKFSYPNGRPFDPSQDEKEARRQMEWESPWGLGFPGWHLECSVMSMKYLGETFDLHAGGMDLRETHHPNEIAQSEAATGKKFVNYWMHGAFVLVNGEKMSKSKGNALRVYDIEKQGFDPLALRYLYMQTHYRQEMNFTFPALEAAQNALNRLRETISNYEDPTPEPGPWPKEVVEEYKTKFHTALSDDLNMPQALAVVWEVIKSDYAGGQKAATLLEFDEVLGFNLAEWRKEHRKIMIAEIPNEVREFVTARQELRKNRQFAMADQLRNKIRKLGYDVQDTKNGIEIKKLLENEQE